MNKLFTKAIGMLMAEDLEFTYNNGHGSPWLAFPSNAKRLWEIDSDEEELHIYFYPLVEVTKALSHTIKNCVNIKNENELRIMIDGLVEITKRYEEIK